MSIQAVRNVTAKEVQESILQNGISRIDHHECVLCAVMVYHFMDRGKLYFNSSCDCSQSMPREISWDRAAERINMQSNPEVKIKVAADYGITLEMDRRNEEKEKTI